MKLRAKSFCQITAMLLPAVFIATAQPMLSQQKSITLTGGADHSEFLPPVPDELKAGAVMRQDTVAPKAKTGGAEWYRIPKWLAGSWPRESVTTDYDVDFKTGESHTKPVTETDITVSDYGYLPDSVGDIWDTAQRFSEVRSDYGKTTGISRITSNRVLSSRENQITMESEGTLTTVDKKKNVIVSTHQCEAIRTITLIGNGTISVETSQKDFDENGQPLSLKRSKFTSQRSAAFDPSKGEADKPLVRRLGQFFMDKFWNDLVPGYYYESVSGSVNP